MFFHCTIYGSAQCHIKISLNKFSNLSLPISTSVILSFEYYLKFDKFTFKKDIFFHLVVRPLWPSKDSFNWIKRQNQIWP